MLKQVHIWKVDDRIVGRVLEGFEGDDWWTRPGGMNNAIWLLGHLVRERRAIGHVLGGDFAETPRDALFKDGTKPDDLPRDLVPSAMLRDYHETHEAFVDFLEALDEETLQEPVEFELPLTPKNRLGTLQFMSMHESYHVGQLGALRAMLGKDS